MTSASQFQMSSGSSRPWFFILEGPIGAGKSTLLDLVHRVLTRQGRTVCIVPEPVDVWVATGALEEFYQDPRQKAYEFQTFVYATRVMRIRDCIKKCPQADVFLIERSVIADRYLFARLLQEGGCFTPLQTVMYDHWTHMWNQLMPFASPDGFIYLAPSLDETLRRIASRGREGEQVSREYQEKLICKHEELFGQGLKPSPPDASTESLDVAITTICTGQPASVLRIYDDGDFRNNEHHSIVRQILPFINSFVSKDPTPGPV